MHSSSNKPQDPLHQYASSVSNLQQKLGYVVSNQQAVADSLSRAVAALRSIAAARQEK